MEPNASAERPNEKKPSSLENRALFLFLPVLVGLFKVNTGQETKQPLDETFQHKLLWWTTGIPLWNCIKKRGLHLEHSSKKIINSRSSPQILS